jgi:hypothetical protein
MFRLLLLYLLTIISFPARSQDPLQNIFIKTDISKTSCYIGEPVVVTFTLFSSVPVVTSGLRSPAFYGFSIIDLVNYKEQPKGESEFQGKSFRTIVLRKVLLYPVQAGPLIIDPMYVETITEAFDPVEQEMAEVEREIVSQAIALIVLPLPGTKPGDYSGAVGQFSLRTELTPASFPVNQQGRLIVVLEGNGNFINTGQPKLAWPNGVESFEPVIRNELRNSDSGTTGTRIFDFAFTVDSVGSFVIPPLNFSFFDPVLKKYQFVQTNALPFSTSPAIGINERIIATSKKNAPVILVTILVLFLASVVFILIRKRKRITIIQTDPAARQKFEPHFSKDAMGDMKDTELSKALVRSLEEFITRNQKNITIDEIREARMIKEDLQRMIYANAIEKNKLDELSGRCFRLFERDHSAYL